MIQSSSTYYLFCQISLLFLIRDSHKKLRERSERLDINHILGVLNTWKPYKGIYWYFINNCFKKSIIIFRKMYCLQERKQPNQNMKRINHSCYTDTYSNTWSQSYFRLVIIGRDKLHNTQVILFTEPSNLFCLKSVALLLRFPETESGQKRFRRRTP